MSWSVSGSDANFESITPKWPIASVYFRPSSDLKSASRSLSMLLLSAPISRDLSASSETRLPGGSNVPSFPTFLFSSSPANRRAPERTRSAASCPFSPETLTLLSLIGTPAAICAAWRPSSSPVILPVIFSSAAERSLGDIGVSALPNVSGVSASGLSGG